MADSSFDIVSKLDRQGVDDAANQTAKEIANHYDFRGVNATIRLTGDAIEMETNSTDRALAILGILRSKLIRRGLSLKCLGYKDRRPKPSGKIYRLVTPLREGIAQGIAKKVSKLIHGEDPRDVRAQTQGDELRTSSEPRNDF